jgi:hypothetical protein
VPFENYDCHLSETHDAVTLLQYLFALDTLNFCFWPSPKFEYENLAAALKNVVNQQSDGLSPKEILKYSLFS